ncbi:MAG: dihydroxyacetone kinase phosphoryl donor subunit DhaM [Synergistaceae bacterium]|nr:dihydroxyacetone kinase phosphoryl donor subunit DhaM [Synergistaceae bacterium]
MVGLVIISHSRALAEGVVELVKMIADDVPVAAAGGRDDGGLGTSFEKISRAIEETDGGDGVILLMDMGSAVMTAEMAVENMEGREIIMADVPIVEGAVAAAAEASAGSSLKDIAASLDEVRNIRKF